jgi:hypothetical protein
MSRVPNVTCTFDYFLTKAISFETGHLMFAGQLPCIGGGVSGYTHSR